MYALVDEYSNTKGELVGVIGSKEYKYEIVGD